MKLDVVMCTWNSNGPWFKHCLRSIKREIPVHCFIVVDKFSTDGTQDAISKFFQGAKFVQLQENLARARKKGIELVDTNYFVSVDADIQLPYGWFKRIISKFSNNVGAIQGVTTADVDYMRKWDEWTQSLWRARAKFKQPVYEVGSTNPDDIRGCTHNTLIKTDLVRDWNPPSWLCAYEDHHLLRHIVKKGYRWKIIPDLNVSHHGLCFNAYLKRVKWGMAGARLIRFNGVGLKLLTQNLIMDSIASFLSAVQMKEPRIIPFIIFSRIHSILGYVGCSKYIVLKR